MYYLFGRFSVEICLQCTDTCLTIEWKTACFSEKGRFFILNCVRFYAQGIRVTAGNLFHLLISWTTGIQASMENVTEAIGKQSGIKESGRRLQIIVLLVEMPLGALNRQHKSFK